MSVNKVVIVGAVRTAVGRAVKGSATHVRPDDMPAMCIDELLARVPEVKPEEIDDVILGCAMPEAEQGMNVARVAVFRSQLPYTVPGMTINRFCCSGMQSVAIAADRIRLGYDKIAIAGGTESMSSVPMGGLKPSPNPWLVENFPSAYEAMGITAEIVAEKYNVSREDQDEFAAESHQKAAKATQAGTFKDEMIPLPLGDGKFLDYDECIRADTTVEGLSKLRPVFKAGGTVTAGNASPINDGAAALMIMDEATAKARGLKPFISFDYYCVAALDPAEMGMGPLYAVRKLWKDTGLTDKDIDVYELNEAFAAQSLPCRRELGISKEKINQLGGAIALGHPLGATGGKLMVTLAYHMRRNNLKTGVVSMCIGGGMGAAGLFRLVD
jgi:acetyl-CoA acyltransferase